MSFRDMYVYVYKYCVYNVCMYCVYNVCMYVFLVVSKVEIKYRMSFMGEIIKKCYESKCNTEQTIIDVGNVIHRVSCC